MASFNPHRRRRRRRNPSSVGDFMHEHPWMTFFLLTGATSAVVTLVRGYPDVVVPGPLSNPTPTPSTPSTPALQPSNTAVASTLAKLGL